MGLLVLKIRLNIIVVIYRMVVIDNHLKSDQLLELINQMDNNIIPIKINQQYGYSKIIKPSKVCCDLNE